ncbi:hypothetical protein Q3G72_006740 [Acer saccharum]|nr:hypothetical protein Q3G72_006740 [Acer saccharum]
MAKRHLLSNVLGANAHYCNFLCKRHRSHRDTMIGNISSRLHAQRRNVQGLGKDVEPIYVKELGTTLSKEEIYKTLIAINIYGCNMDKKQWENPNEWNPERFFDSKYDAMDMYKTMAFGAGKRVCTGSLQATAIGRLEIGARI